MNASQSRSLIVSTTLGRVEGAPGEGVIAFRGIPYAAPPLGPLRFRPPAPHPGWTGVRETRAPAAVPPQNPSRLRNVLGDYDLPQNEDCLTLDVIRPADLDQPAPVLVWLYGGAFVTGGTAIPWYDGTAFAAQHGLVFVAPNYRLGALGFLAHPELGPGNAGLRDQVAALEWVRDNIAEFGGDPERVTVMGQSAGSISVFGLLAHAPATPLFHQAILQSGRFNSLASRETMEGSGESFFASSGLSADALRALPIDQLLALQGQAIRENAQFSVTSTPFRPAADGEHLPLETFQAAVEGARGKRIMLGWTRDELSAFFADDPQIASATPAQIDEAMKRHWGGNWAEGAAYIQARAPGSAVARTLALAVNECTFAGSTVAFAEALATVSAPWLYRFDWGAAGNRFAATHCVELPFIFDNTAQWYPPMHEPSSPEERRALALVLNHAWASFASAGNPQHERLPSWAPYTRPERSTLRIDTVIEPVGDLAGLSHPNRPWPTSVPLPRS